MTTYWLTPLEWDGETAALGSERFALAPADKRERFVRALQSVHPRLLLAFKAHLLPADEAYEACGTDELPFDLGSGLPIVLQSLEAAGLQASDAVSLLSHCGESYLSSVPSPGEADRLLREADLPPDTEDWAAAMRSWIARGNRVILLREDGADR